MSLACSRSLFFMASIAAALALGISSYLEYVVGLRPCSFCLLQRFCLILFLVSCLTGSIHGPGRRGSTLYGTIGLISASGGMALAWRQVLLQGESVEPLFDCVPQSQGVDSWLCVLDHVLNGTIDCTSLNWTLFDLSIPEWSLLFFLAVSIVMTYLLLRLVWHALVRPLGGDSPKRGRALD